MGAGLRMLVAVLALLALDRPAWASKHRVGASANLAGRASTAVTIAPRVEARIGDKQLVLIYANRQQFVDRSRMYRLFGGIQPVELADPRIIIFLESFVDASPVAGATFEAVINFLPEPLTEKAPGIYLSGPTILGGGRNEIELNYQIGGESGVLLLVLIVPGGASSGTAAVAIDMPPQNIPNWLLAVLGVALFILIGGVFYPRRRGSRA